MFSQILIFAFSFLFSDRAPFVFTSDMAYVINGGDKPSSRFHDFVDLCCEAYNRIRKHAHLFLNLLGLVRVQILFYHSFLLFVLVLCTHRAEVKQCSLMCLSYLNCIASFRPKIVKCLRADAVQWNTRAVGCGWSEVRLWCTEATWIGSWCHHALHQVNTWRLLFFLQMMFTIQMKITQIL